jgi:ribosomal protein S18 acetylase RimI-like enzyme
LDIPDVQVVEVSLKDLKRLQEISRRTFYDSFASMNTAQNMAFHLANHFTDEKLTAEILTPDSKFFFANNKDVPVGYIKINQGSAQTVLPNAEAIEIERIYVDQAFKGAGIGRLLIGKAVELANTFYAKYLWLGVWEHNLPAIRFYEKNGFKQFSKHIFKLGDDEQTDLLLKREFQH